MKQLGKCLILLCFICVQSSTKYNSSHFTSMLVHPPHSLHYPHFISDKRKTEKDVRTCLGSPRWSKVRCDWNPGLSAAVYSQAMGESLCVISENRGAPEGGSSENSPGESFLVTGLCPPGSTADTTVSSVMVYLMPTVSH